MIETNHLTAFLLTVYLLILIPGPSVLFTVSRGVALGRRAALATVAGNTAGLAGVVGGGAGRGRGVALGRRAALATVAGNTAGLAAQLGLVVVGLGAVLARSDTIYTTLKLI